MDLAAFRARLESLVGRPTQVRPFVCDGSPLDCDVMIVGSNPATSMEKDWWEWWDPKHGFKRNAWLEHYRVERARQPLKPGKTRRMPISNTRRVLDWIAGSAYPVKCLETNIYSTPTVSIAELTPSLRSTAIFDFLFDTIRPAVVLAHGSDAAAHLGSLLMLTGWMQTSQKVRARYL